MIKALITDDNPRVRQGLRQILESIQNISLIDEACGGEELMRKIKLTDYHVILLDISMPGKSGLELIKEIVEINQEAAILMVSMHEEEYYAQRAMKLGASGYLAKAKAPDQLVKAIETIIEGGKYFPALIEPKSENILMV